MHYNDKAPPPWFPRTEAKSFTKQRLCFAELAIDHIFRRFAAISTRRWRWRTGTRVSRAARLLGLSRATLRYRLEKMGL